MSHPIIPRTLPLTLPVILSLPATLSSLLCLEQTRHVPNTQLWQLLFLWNPHQMPLKLHLGLVLGSYPLVLKVKRNVSRFIIHLQILSKVEHIYLSSSKTV